jgi:hypothetical protein
MADEISKMINNDPLVYNLFANDTKYDFKKDRSINWIKIPTSFISENGKDSSISLMSVYTYSGDQCQQIKNSINDPSDIVFSNDGHVAVNFKQKKTVAEFFYPNPTVTKNTGGNTVNSPIGISNTIKMGNTNFETSFFHNDKILFSQNLKWILYQLPGSYYAQSSTGGWTITNNKKDKDAVPVYVLLYNTIHRKNFQDIYAKIINLTDNPFSTQSFIGSNTSYSTVIKKYCNAFKISKYVSPTTGEQLYHYADPACELAFDTQIAKLSQTLSLNLTDETWRKKFYPNGQAGFSAAVQDLSAVPSSDAYCSRGSGGGPSRFLREKAKVINANSNSDSFMQILANYEISASSEDSGAKMPAKWNSQQPGNSTTGAVCGPKSINFVDCSVTMSSQGNLVLNKDNIRPVCGNQAGAAAKGKKPYNPLPDTKPPDTKPPDTKPSDTKPPDTKPSDNPPINPISNLGIEIYILVIIIILAILAGVYFIL